MNFKEIIEITWRKIVNWMTPIKGWIDRNNGTLNVLATIALVVVSIFLYNATTSSTNTARAVGKLEATLAIDRAKSDIIEQIRIGENLLVEIDNNIVFIGTYRDIFEEHIDDDGIKESFKNTIPNINKIRTTRALQATESISFGSLSIRSEIDAYLVILNSLKQHIEEIKISTRFSDYKIKEETMRSFILISNQLVGKGENDSTLDKFVENIKGYIQERKLTYQALNNKTQNELLNMFE